MFHDLSKYISSQRCDVLSVDDFIEHDARRKGHGESQNNCRYGIVADSKTIDLWKNNNKRKKKKKDKVLQKRRSVKEGRKCLFKITVDMAL